MSYLLIYTCAMVGLVFLAEYGQTRGREYFLAAERKVGGLIGAMSVAASWIWAPALFVSTKIGYEWGYAGLVWFVAPNMLSLILFVFVATHVKRRLPEGYSYIGSLKDLPGGRIFRMAQLLLQITMQVVIFSLQLTAGGKLLSLVTSAPYQEIVLFMTILPLCYTMIGGLHTSVFTDALQYIVIAVCVLALLAGFPYGAIEPEIAMKPFHPFDSGLLVEFGVSSAVGLLFAIFADQQQWQRIFAARRGLEKKTFIRAALMHGFVTVSLGTLGILVYLTGFAPDKPEMTGAEFIRSHMAAPFIVAFVFMALCGLCSTIDSAYSAFGSLVGTELLKTANEIRTSRLSMLILGFLGLFLAVVNLPIVVLWFLAGTIRLAAFVPTVLSILRRDRFNATAGTAAILAGIVCGGSLFIAGIVGDNSLLRTVGMLTSLGISGLVCSAPLLRRRRFVRA